jgi:hypothetical protein
MKIITFVCAALGMAGVAFAARTASAGTWELMGKCLDVTDGNDANGAKVQLWTCNGNRQQQWIGPLLDGTVRPLMDESKCLDLNNWDTTNGDPDTIQIWNCSGGTNQRWWIDPVDHYLKGYGSKCVDDPGFNNSDGTKLDYYDCNGGANQQFYFGSPQYCTQQNGWNFQDFENTVSPPSWYRVYDSSTTYGPYGFCGNSCTYTRVFGKGNYGSCPF